MPPRRGPRIVKKKRRARRSMDATRLRAARTKKEDIDYKNVVLLQRVTSAQGKLFSRKRTGLDAQCQRRAALALKRARFLAMMPYIT